MGNKTILKKYSPSKEIVKFRSFFFATITGLLIWAIIILLVYLGL